VVRSKRHIVHVDQNSDERSYKLHPQTVSLEKHVSDGVFGRRSSTTTTTTISLDGIIVGPASRNILNIVSRSVARLYAWRRAGDKGPFGERYTKIVRVRSSGKSSARGCACRESEMVGVGHVHRASAMVRCVRRGRKPYDCMSWRSAKKPVLIPYTLRSVTLRARSKITRNQAACDPWLSSAAQTRFASFGTVVVFESSKSICGSRSWKEDDEICRLRVLHCESLINAIQYA
jgi:hypothetical protein